MSEYDLSIQGFDGLRVKALTFFTTKKHADDVNKSQINADCDGGFIFFLIFQLKVCVNPFNLRHLRANLPP